MSEAETASSSAAGPPPNPAKMPKPHRCNARVEDFVQASVRLKGIQSWGGQPQCCRVGTASGAACRRRQLVQGQKIARPTELCCMPGVMEPHARNMRLQGIKLPGESTHPHATAAAVACPTPDPHYHMTSFLIPRHRIQAVQSLVTWDFSEKIRPAWRNMRQCFKSEPGCGPLLPLPCLLARPPSCFVPPRLHRWRPPGDPLLSLAPCGWTALDASPHLCCTPCRRSCRSLELRPWHAASPPWGARAAASSPPSVAAPSCTRLPPDSQLERPGLGCRRPHLLPGGAPPARVGLGRPSASVLHRPWLTAAAAAAAPAAAGRSPRSPIW